MDNRLTACNRQAFARITDSMKGEMRLLDAKNFQRSFLEAFPTMVRFWCLAARVGWVGRQALSAPSYTIPYPAGYRRWSLALAWALEEQRSKARRLYLLTFAALGKRAQVQR